MIRRNILSALFILAACLTFAVPSYAAKPTTDKSCKECHKPAADVIRGNLFGVSEKFKTVQVSVGSLIWVIKYGDDLKLVGADKLTTIPRGKAVAVTFSGPEKTPYAVTLSVKPEAKVPPGQLITLDELKKLVERGPEKGGFVLVDSRPAPRYKEGHLPYAVNLPLDKFDSLKDKVLPKDKNKLVIFYCGGLTCQLSPESARRAKELGYTKVKVFHAGMPAWQKAAQMVVEEPGALQDLIEKELAYVAIDLRPAAEAAKGYIQGAVSVPIKDLAAAKERFPGDKSAPIILYGNGNIEKAFHTVRNWGYSNTAVLNGGIRAWTKAGGKLLTGKLTTVISYVPKPRPGEISIEEFKEIVEKGAPGEIIVDVRDPDETANGMLKGAINIPGGKIKEMVSKIPKDKELVVHCSTGIRAEMAYEDLKELGFKVRFLNALIQIDKDGKYEITKK